MTSSCCRNGPGGEQPSTYGLISGHAYTLLDVVDLEGGPTLAKLRNPWSSESYHGPWSDSDSRWTAAWKEQVNLVVADDGIFFMDYDEYLSIYKNINVAFTNDNYQHV